MKTTGLRFFTVYGPWGRPDMAPFLFTKAILSGEPIKVFNNGDLMRDFTYIDDIIQGISSVVNKTANTDNKYNLYNIGNNSPERLMDFINAIENACNKKAILDMYPMQAGDVYQTYANTKSLNDYCGYESNTSINKGISILIDWYKSYYKI